MSTASEQPKLWSSTQAYALSFICLLLGSVTGYLLHSPSAPAPAPAAQTAQPSAPMGMDPSKVTPDQMKRMAEQKAAPLLAELKDKPKDPELLAKVGNIYLAAHQLDMAKDYYQRSLAINPKSAVVLNQLASVDFYAGDPDKAIVDLHKALDVDPKFGDALFNLGMIEWQAKSDPKAAIADWEKFLKTNPNHPGRAHVEEMVARAKQHLNLPPGSKTDKPAM